MEAKDYLSYIVNEVHTVVVATADDMGLPVTAAIDMMDCDEDSLYFLTACQRSRLSAQASASVGQRALWKATL